MNNDMNRWARFALMYSSYNFAFACLYVAFPYAFPWHVVEVLRANAIIVASAVLYFRVVYTSEQILAFYRELFGDIPSWLITCIDIVFHFLPVVMLGGFPRVWWAFPVAYSVLIAWYILIRDHVSGVYGDLMPSSVMDTFVLHYGVIFVMICSILSICFGLKKLSNESNGA